ncbi:hypothetical protein [Magnetospirillum molischianum]|nr:hypothetical protein [Magnetospirillum molischianum]
MLRSVVFGCLALVAVTGLASPPAAAAVAIDLPAIVGQSKATVAQVLGKPAKCEQSKYGERCAYRGGTEVIFIGGAADWITILPQGVLYSPAALEAIGLASVAPDFTGPQAMRWDAGLRETLTQQSGATVTVPLREITINPGGGGTVGMIYVKAVTR